MVRWAQVVLRLTLFILAVGLTHVKADSLEPVSEQRLDEMLDSLAHVPLSVSIQEKVLKTTNECVYAEAYLPVISPIDGKIKTQLIRIARPNQIKPVPVIMIVPTIQAYLPMLEGRAAKYFCENGYASVVADVNDPSDPVTMPSWDKEDNNHRMAIHALRTTIDFIETHPHFDSRRIGGIGFSLGGMTMAMLAGVDERLQAVFTAAAGGNFPYILTNSTHPKIVDLRDRRMQYLKMTSVKEYEKFLAKRLIYDPIYFARRVKPGQIMMMTVRKDVKVPPEAQEELWQALRKPKRLILNRGHIGSIVDLVYRHLNAVIAHMNERMN